LKHTSAAFSLISEVRWVPRHPHPRRPQRMFFHTQGGGGPWSPAAESQRSGGVGSKHGPATTPRRSGGCCSAPGRRTDSLRLLGGTSAVGWLKEDSGRGCCLQDTPQPLFSRYQAARLRLAAANHLKPAPSPTNPSVEGSGTAAMLAGGVLYEPALKSPVDMKSAISRTSAKPS
jgi:hypothetical protein